MNKNMMLEVKSGDDLWETPDYAVEIIIPFLQERFKGKIIWCPFDNSFSPYVKLLLYAGFRVIYSHINDDKDFFKYKPKKFDLIISNPPWSIKDKVLQRCYDLKKPFALLLPIHSLSGKFRWEMFSKNKLQLLMSRERINYIHTKPQKFKRAPFESAYFAYRIFKKQLNWEKTQVGGPTTT